MNGPRIVAAFPGTLLALVGIAAWLQRAGVRRETHLGHPEPLSNWPTDGAGRRYVHQHADNRWLYVGPTTSAISPRGDAIAGLHRSNTGLAWAGWGRV